MGHPAAPGQVLQHPLADRLGLGHHLPAPGLGRFEDVLGRSLGLGLDLHRDPLGLLGAQGQERLGLLVGPIAFPTGVTHEPGDLLLGPATDLRRRLPGHLEHPARLVAQCRLDLLVGGHARCRSRLGCLQALVMQPLTLSGGSQLGRHLREERSHLVLGEPPEGHRELPGGDLLGPERDVVHKVMVGGQG